MAQLRVTVPDELTLTFTCASYARVRERALAFITDSSKLLAKCKTTVPGAELAFCLDEDAPPPEPWPTRAWESDFDAFFFDNTVYNVYAEVEGAKGFRNLRVQSRFAADEGVKRFARLGKNGTIRCGDINFENDVGKFDFTLLYEDANGATRRLTFSSEVLSQKLDARDDWKTMIDDVEERYAMLAADFLRQTYHSFGRKAVGSKDTPDLIWWNLYEAERTTFVKAVRTILERPRKRLRSVVEYVRADQLKHLTPQQECLWGEHKLKPLYLYRNAYDTHSHDTPENRFVKHAIEKIGRKYAELKKLICSESQFGKRISDSEKARMDENEAWFRKTLANPFFKGVGRFTGLKQLSLTLQNAPGYATVMRTYAILNSSYMLFEGLKRLETKSIADLYEIWCFLKVEDIVKTCCRRQFGGLFVEPKANHGELSGKFVKQLGTGSTSEVVFSVKSGNKDIELARIVYNPKITEQDRKNNGLPDVVFPTGLTKSKGQIPDIVLRLTRSSMNRDETFRLTYLFDAKYRIEDGDGAGEDAVMRPPQDAIDQMHRYRDAIYYAEPNKKDSLLPADLKREVIGGYVLFPGVAQGGVEKPETGEDKRPPYFKSIDSVNIGAIPLRPNSGAEYGDLVSFVTKLVADNPTLEAAFDRLNPQHGAALNDSSQEGVAEAFLCGTYRDKQKDWIKRNNLYNLPKETAELTGVFSLEDAKKKQVLVLLSSRGYLELSTPYKIVGCKEVGKAELKNDYGYFREPTHDSYYLFEIQPLIEPLKIAKAKLKVVTLSKGGVCAGVSEAAQELGVEIETVANVKAALDQADGVVLFDVSRFIDHSVKNVIDGAREIRKSHQPLAMDMRWKKTRKLMVRWLRILLGQVQTRKYVLYIDGRESDPNHDLKSLAKVLLADVVKMV